MFLSALAGIGYVPPPDTEALVMSSAAAFKIGQPVYDGADSVNGQQIMAARRKMEEAWDKKKRPKDVSFVRDPRFRSVRLDWERGPYWLRIDGGLG